MGRHELEVALGAQYRMKLVADQFVVEPPRIPSSRFRPGADLGILNYLPFRLGKKGHLGNRTGPVVFFYYITFF